MALQFFEEFSKLAQFTIGWNVTNKIKVIDLSFIHHNLYHFSEKVGLLYQLFKN